MTGTMRNSSGLLAAVCGLLIACGSPASDDGPRTVTNPEWGAWQDAAEIPFRFVLEQTFGAEDEPEAEVLAGISAVATDDHGNVYLLDSRANRIVSFDEGGSFRWTYGSAGRGPGELTNAYGLAWDGADHLLLANQQGTRLERISLDGAYVDAWTGESLGTSWFQMVGVFGPTRVVLQSSLFGKLGARVVVADLDEPPRAVSAFEIDQTGSLVVPEGLAASPRIGMTPEAIVVGSVDRYHFTYFDSTGTETRTVSREVDGMVRPGVYSDGSSASISMLSSLSLPVSVGGGYSIVQASWPTNISDPDDYLRRRMVNREEITVRRKSVTDLYDEHMNLLYSWTLDDPEPGIVPAIMHADAEGRVYAATNAGFPQIGRYRVEVSPPR